MVVTAGVLVVAAAIPASLKVVYPVYNRFFPQKSAQASHPGTADSGSGPGAPSGGSGPGAPSSEPGAEASGPGVPSNGTAAAGPKSGILVVTDGITDTSSRRTYGFLDPSSGKYSEVASFNTGKAHGGDFIKGEVGVSPDFTKVAVTLQVKGQQQTSAGWIDTSGNFTSVTQEVSTGAFGGNPPRISSVGFDGTGNFFYLEWGSTGMDVYKLAAGSTTNAQKISSGTLGSLLGFLNYDGSMQLDCGVAPNWLGPDNSVSANGSQINKQAITARTDKGCPTSAYGTMPTPLLPKENVATVTDAVGSHDGTKVAFKYYGRDSGGASQQSNASLYTVAADGSGQPTKVNLTNITGEQLSKMTFLRWV
jgi:hypothetical protein